MKVYKNLKCIQFFGMGMIVLTNGNVERYYIDLPEACPLDGAHKVDNDINVYRIVENFKPNEDDFQPLGLKRSKGYFKKKSQLLYCKSLALSVLGDFTDAENAKASMSIRYSSQRFIAKGTITPSCGRISNTPGPIGNSHISWWPFFGVNPCLSFEVVGGETDGS
ncbi:hypothetical protein QW71_09740 [Paenibacillus sp. IHB B 3415]|uniref:hypothetical protein n=1 Tax=Paenibacillus sp. IHB B 3415 TaxID=867080 RepID=UPI000575D12B|nr:hypothetical protein [Paenibacillus sp. IHB B 3415]KHL95880.1 hypothetical protein QW71_09740 [Paenibacillus sp. IHB B 3415]